MTNQPAPAVWIDGDPLMEAIASAVWEHCRTEHPSSVVDDPRNIAAVAAAAVARAAVPAMAPATDRAASGSGREAEAELYVLLRKAGEDRYDAQGLIDRHRDEVLRRAELRRMAAESAPAAVVRRAAAETSDCCGKPAGAICVHDVAQQANEPRS